jgi:hypothetical protein
LTTAGIVIGSRPSRVRNAVIGGDDRVETMTARNSYRALAVGIVATALTVGPPAGAARSCDFEGTFGTRSSDPDRRRPVRFLTGVRAGAHRCFDRATFEFRTSEVHVPGYRIGYESAPIREDGSGRPVPVRGDAFLVVRLTPARDTRLSGAGAPRPTYRGPEAVEPRGGTRIIEVRRVSSYEGAVKWAIGVDRRRPFQVSTLRSPPRVVIDVG